MSEPKPPELSDIAVTFTCNGQTTQEKGRLMGVAALLVQTEREAPLQAEAEVRFHLRPNSPLIQARGVVAAHLPGQGLRVQITDLAEEHRRHILELLYPPGKDRRASQRVSLVTQMRTVVNGETLVGYTRDVSTGGIFVETETETPLAKGSEVQLRFRLTPESPILEVRAAVAYALPGEGMGLRFLDPPAELRQTIEAFVTQR